jgi:hypothetical protein
MSCSNRCQDTLNRCATGLARASEAHQALGLINFARALVERHEKAALHEI